MDKVVLFGNGQVASLAYFYLTHDSPSEVAAFTVDRKYIEEKTLFGLPIVPFEDIENIYPPDKYKMHISISYKNVNRLRAEKYYQAKEKGYQLISYVSSKATTWPGLIIGENCMIMESNIIQPFAEIGNNVTMGCGNHIGHHSVIKDHCFLASHVSVSGYVTVESYCFLGVNSAIRDGIIIASECVIGAGTVILKSTEERGVYISKRAELSPIPSNKLSKM